LGDSEYMKKMRTGQRERTYKMWEKLIEQGRKIDEDVIRMMQNYIISECRSGNLENAERCRKYREILDAYWNNMKYHSFVYIVFLITFCAFFLLGLPKLQYGIRSSLVAVISYSTSLYFYPQKYTGAIWCYYVVFLPMIYYLLRKIIL